MTSKAKHLLLLMHVGALLIGAFMLIVALDTPRFVIAGDEMQALLATTPQVFKSCQELNHGYPCVGSTNHEAPAPESHP